MSVEWPPDLVDALVQRRAIIFLGSGASATCQSSEGVKFPTWRALLKSLSSDLTGDDKAAFDQALEASRYLDAAQLVTDVVGQPARERKLTDLFANKSIRPSELYEYINLIDQPIVMTTNYDQMYERYWETFDEVGSPQTQLYVAKYYDDDVVDHLRSARQLLLKLHGDILQVKRIVLSRSQYSNAKYEHANFFKIVSALLLTRTVLFIGCGFNGDPDVDLILEDSAFAAQSGWPHYAVIAKGRHSSELKSIRSSFNVECLEYDNDDGSHAELLTSLRQLADLVVNGRS